MAVIRVMEMAEEDLYLEEGVDLYSILTSFVKDGRNQVILRMNIQSDTIIVNRSTMSLMTMSNFNGVPSEYLSLRIDMTEKAIKNTVPYLSVRIK